MHKMTLLMVAVPLLGACAATGPADDGFENSQESTSIGRVFSQDGSAYTIFRSQQSEDDKSTPEATAPASAEAFDIHAYQEWRKARATQSAEYQKFMLWKEFEAFQRWRDQQDTE